MAWADSLTPIQCKTHSSLFLHPTLPSPFPRWQEEFGYLFTVLSLIFSFFLHRCDSGHNPCIEDTNSARIQIQLPCYVPIPGILMSETLLS